MEKDQKVASEKDPKIDLFEDDDEFEEFNINEGSGCTIVWHTNAISAVLDLGQETKPHISPIRPLTPEEQLESVKKLEGLPNREHKNCKLKLFLEVDLGLEIKFDPCIMCEHIHKRTSFRLSQIEDEDIICFQKSTPLESEIE
ncbi:hypothetical protein DVH24_005135 [Malus domestica]|uniref:Uncharacterized protein n=1 Tax=Malus domestica TaxID=3750 RepID=A0A498IIB5_MALDO|nr:hypothetical protein DVH24_005135 [Malus domestica]